MKRVGQRVGSLETEGFTRNRQGLLIGGLALLLCFIGWLLWQCVDSQVLGFIKDDGVYAITGKALAQGKGFRLIHVVGQPFQTKYPIGYPLILSLGWLIFPQFPQNLPLLTGITMGFGLAALGLLFFYLRDRKHASLVLSFAIMLLVACNERFISLSTSLMSEMPYLFFTLAAFYWVEGGPERRSKAWLPVCIVLSAVCFHLRLIGLLLIPAIALWLFLQNRKREAVVYMASTLAFTVLPWLIYVKTLGLHNTPLTAPIFNTYSDYWSASHNLYQQQNYFFWLTVTAQAFIFQCLDFYLPLVPRLGFAPLWIFGVAIFWFLYLLFRTISPLWKAPKAPLRALSPSAIYLILCIPVLIFWNYAQELPRFFLVLAPWLWYALLAPLDRLASHRLRVSILFVLLSIALIPAAVDWEILRQSRQNHVIDARFGPQIWPEYGEAFRYITAHTSANAVIACTYEAPVYLYTGHPTMHVNLRSLPVINGAVGAESLEALLKSMQAYHVRYLLLEPQLLTGVPGQMNPVMVELIRLHPDRFELVFRSSGTHVALIRFLGSD